MTREEFYTSDRNEVTIYAARHLDDLVPVPLTRTGFESLCETVTGINNLILDDGVRSLVAGYIHHVPNNEMNFVLGDLAKVVYKTLSNNLTFTIDQECKARAKAELEAKKETTSNVHSIKKEEPQAH